MIADKPTYEEMEFKLAEAEDLINALRDQEVDAIIGEKRIALVRLREVEETLRKTKAELEQRVVERTADLARVNTLLRKTVGEQEQTWRRLQKSERRLLKAQQIARIGNWEWDLRCDTQWWSDEIYRLFGVEPGEVEPGCEAFLSFVHPADRECLKNAIRDTVNERRPYTGEFRILRRDGQERFMHSEIEVTQDGGGNVIQIMGTTQDVTESRLAQQQLRDQAELLDLAYDMIFVHDMTGRITFWNHGAEMAYGWTKEQAVGQLGHALLKTEYSEPLIRIMARIIREGHWEGEVIHTTRDGRKVTVATRWALRRGPDSRPVAILQIDSDITDRKRAEREMAEARHFAESIVDTVQECLVVLDPQLRVISANRSFHEIFGLAPDQIEGLVFHTLGDGLWDIPELREGLRAVLSESNSVEDFQLECEVAGSEPKSLVLSARPILKPVGGAGMILLAIQDVTISVRQRREIQADKEQLALLTEELVVTEERQRRQIAQALHDTIGQSLAFAKRELNLLHKQAPVEMRDSLKQVSEQICDAIEQTRNLTFELSPSTLHMFGLEAAVEELAEQFSECEGFSCRVRGPGQRVPLTDHVQSLLYRSVRELLVNVAKHALARNVSVLLEQGERDVRVTVQDDGRGFDPAGLRAARGSDRGFGLFSIRERLTHAGGGFVIDSAEGRGTTVMLTAPLDFEYRQE